jgi:hypothetical protein
VRTVVRTISAVLAVVAQYFLMWFLVDNWAAHYYVAGGECGWDGTCVEDMTGPAVVTAWWCLPAAEVAIAVLLSVPAYLSKRREPDGDRPRLGALVVRRLPTVILVGAASTLFLIVQNAVIDQLTEADDRPQAWAPDAATFLRVSIAAVVVEVGIAAVATVAVWHRRHRRAARRGASSQ